MRLNGSPARTAAVDSRVSERLARPTVNSSANDEIGWRFALKFSFSNSFEKPSTTRFLREARLFYCQPFTIRRFRFTIEACEFCKFHRRETSAASEDFYIFYFSLNIVINKDKKKEQSEKLNEMRRLYEQEGRSLRQIGKQFGMSGQGVHEHFIKIGVKMRTGKPVPKVLDRETLIRLYIDEELTFEEVKCRLKTTGQVLSREFERHGILKRSRGFFKRKYPRLYRLEVGEITIVPRPATTQPFRTLYQMAQKAGIKISVKSLGTDSFQITRVE